MKVKSLVEFSGVPKGTTATCEKEIEPNWTDKPMWKVTWNLPLKLFGTKRKPLQDWFDDEEKAKYLVVVN